MKPSWCHFQVVPLSAGLRPPGEGGAALLLGQTLQQGTGSFWKLPCLDPDHGGQVLPCSFPLGLQPRVHWGKACCAPTLHRGPAAGPTPGAQGWWRRREGWAAALWGWSGCEQAGKQTVQGLQGQTGNQRPRCPPWTVSDSPEERGI